MELTVTDKTEALTKAVGDERTSGHQREFEQLVRRHSAAAFNVAYRMTGNRSDAEDLTQETFVRIYRALPRLRAEGASAAWVRRIAVNLCVDALRRKGKAPFFYGIADLPARSDDDAIQLVDSSGDPFDIVVRTLAHDEVHNAIGALPSDYRTVIVLHHLQGMRVEDVANLLDVPAGTIKSRLSRARHALRKLLAPAHALDTV